MKHLACKQELPLDVCESTGCWPKAVLQCLFAWVYVYPKHLCMNSFAHFFFACIRKPQPCLMCMCVQNNAICNPEKKGLPLWHFPHVVRCVVRPSSVRRKMDCCSFISCNPAVTEAGHDISPACYPLKSAAFFCTGEVRIAKTKCEHVWTFPVQLKNTLL